MLFSHTSYGTGSYPPFAKGWHRKILLTAKKLPLKKPYFSIASIAYWEQVGVYIHVGLLFKGDKYFLYKFIRKITNFFIYNLHFTIPCSFPKCNTALSTSEYFLPLAVFLATITMSKPFSNSSKWSRILSLINRVVLCLTTLFPTFLLTVIPKLFSPESLLRTYITKYLLA